MFTFGLNHRGHIGSYKRNYVIRHHFKPNFQIIGNVKGTRFIQDLEKEVGVYSASYKFIRNNCGPIANEILDRIPQWYYDEAKSLGMNVNCDVRIHRLYPGDYPAFPGWHCDGEYRSTYFSQPDLEAIKVSKHIVVTISSFESGVSNPEYLNKDIYFETDEINQTHTLWQQVNNHINNNIKPTHEDIYETKDGEIICFDNWTLHRVMPAKIRGWRLFFRMSMWHKPNLNGDGMISKQETVYRLIDNVGW